MVKFIVFCTKIIAVSIAALLFSSCHANINWDDGIDGNENVTRQIRKVENNFSKIEVSRGLIVTLEKSESYFIEVEADENLQGHITTKVENGLLIITADENINQAKAKTIHIKLPTLTSVESTSGSSVSTKNSFGGTDLLIKTSSGSETELNVEYDTIKSESSSGSTLNLKGKALKLNAASSSGSSIEAKDLLVNEITAKASSGGTINVHPGISLNAKASSGGSIDYSGLPKTVIKEESSGGSVSKD
ncbi:head GIN domain-containing protein [Flavobacterium sp.]|uniref:head GIN domain-containing protein n=1 Tax=Flavobacterium sp. TaxID=239 RepID=UPI0025EE77FB|nr:head GIN domain-containing protein [Flavobacterium sp.]